MVYHIPVHYFQGLIRILDCKVKCKNVRTIGHPSFLLKKLYKETNYVRKKMYLNIQILPKLSHAAK